jgi:uncharacterized protein
MILRHPRVLPLAGLALVLLARAASAQPAASGAGADATLLMLSQRAEKAVPRDRLTAELRTEATGADPAKLQAGINRTMTAALARAKEVPGVAVETTSYTVYQRRTGETLRWQASQGLRLSSRDFGALLGLAGALQARGLVLADLTPSVAPESVARVEDELTNEALARLKRRADAIAAALGQKVERFRELRVGNATTGGMVRPMAVLRSAAAPPPVVEAGDATVSLSVDATIALVPGR